MTMTGFTPLNTQHCTLNESRVDLWQFSLKHELHNAYQLLDDEEKTRGDRFYFSHHKRRFITARATLRIILSRYLNIPPERIEFSYNTQGKPSVFNSQKLEFNISHSGDLALLAIGKRYSLGVDIEYFSARPFEDIGKHSFSEQEFNAFLKVPESLKPIVFFHIWAQKEALIKATGLGLAYPTKDFNVPTTMPTKQLIDDPLHNTTWQMRTFMPEVACCGALCYHPTVRELRHGYVQLHQQTSLSF